MTLNRPLIIVFHLTRHFNWASTLVLKLLSIHPPEFCSNHLSVIHEKSIHCFAICHSSAKNNVWIMSLICEKYVHYFTIYHSSVKNPSIILQYIIHPWKIRPSFYNISFICEKFVHSFQPSLKQLYPGGHGKNASP